MRINRFLLVTLLAGSALLASCTGPVTYEDNEKYEEKALNVYRKNDGPDQKKFTVRFYESTPNIPYVNILDFYKEFFAHSDYTLKRDDYTYTLKNRYGSFLKMDAKNEIFSYKNAQDFSNHAESVQTLGLTFMKETHYTITGYAEKIISLKDYGINIHAEGSYVYMPLSFLSIFSGGTWLYNIVYNGRDIFVYDRQGILSDGVSRSDAYYGDVYYEPIRDLNTPRSKDVAAYTYGQLCCAFDNFRGLTTQLAFGDNNLLSLGANGILEEYFPNIKKLLLSLDKKEYYAGYNLFMGGMYDGGHTASLMSQDPVCGIKTPLDLDPAIYQKEIEFYKTKFITVAQSSSIYKNAFAERKQDLFDYVPATSTDPGKQNYYYYDEMNKTAYIGFDSFAMDNDAWDDYYRNHKSPEEAPVNTDAYAYIRSKFYQAKADGAKNLVLDLATNGGGNTGALLGIMGLFNKGKAYIGMANIPNHTRITDYVDIDINLDGKWDEEDVKEASSFDFNFGVITTKYAFSCANLLPCLLKENGIKTLGAQSGGGSCSIVINSTTDGLVFVRSSTQCLSNANGDNLDSGVPVDLSLKINQTETGIDVSEFYDFKAIGDYLSTAYNESN